MVASKTPANSIVEVRESVVEDEGRFAQPMLMIDETWSKSGFRNSFLNLDAVLKSEGAFDAPMGLLETLLILLDL